MGFTRPNTSLVNCLKRWTINVIIIHMDKSPTAFNMDGGSGLLRLNGCWANVFMNTKATATPPCNTTVVALSRLRFDFKFEFNFLIYV